VRRGTRRNDAYSALAQVSARSRRAGDCHRCSLRIPDGRLSATAIVLVHAVFTVIAVKRRLVGEQRLFRWQLRWRAQLAEHAFGRQQRRWRCFDAEPWRRLAIFFFVGQQRRFARRRLEHAKRWGRKLRRLPGRGLARRRWFARWRPGWRRRARRRAVRRRDRSERRPEWWRPEWRSERPGRFRGREPSWRPAHCRYPDAQHGWPERWRRRKWWWPAERFADDFARCRRFGGRCLR
jgi:hypothetical protein